MLKDVKEEHFNKWEKEVKLCIENYYFENYIIELNPSENSNMESDIKKKQNKKQTTEDKDKKAEEIFKTLKKSRILGKILFTKLQIIFELFLS